MKTLINKQKRINKQKHNIKNYCVSNKPIKNADSFPWNNNTNYYLDAIMNCDSMSKYELLIG